jgi:hypothetical protein
MNNFERTLLTLLCVLLALVLAGFLGLNLPNFLAPR